MDSADLYTFDTIVLLDFVLESFRHSLTLILALDDIEDLAKQSARSLLFWWRCDTTFML